MAFAFGIVTVLYVGLAVATVGVTSGSHSKVPLADLMSVGFGETGRRATTVLAVALTMGTMNVYIGGASKLAAALAEQGALPRWLAGDARRSVPRRPLIVIGAVGVVLLVALLLGVSSTSDLIRATSACFVAVYVAATASAVRILRGSERAAAIVALALVTVVAGFSGWYLLLPAGSAICFVLIRQHSFSASAPCKTEKALGRPDRPSADELGRQRGCSFGGGEGDRDREAALRAGPDIEHGLVRRGDRRDDRESETHAVTPVGPVRAEPLERLREPRDVVRRDARPAVRDREHRVAAVARGRARRRSGRRGTL